MSPQTPAVRRYLRRFFPAIIAYSAALMLATWAIRAWQPRGLALVALAILPALPMIGVIAVIGLYIVEEKDEYLRQRAVSAMLVGLGLMLSVATAWGFLEEADVVPHAPAYWAFVIWCFGWGVAQCTIQLIDRRGGGQ